MDADELQEIITTKRYKVKIPKAAVYALQDDEVFISKIDGVPVKDYHTLIPSNRTIYEIAKIADDGFTIKLVLDKELLEIVEYIEDLLKILDGYTLTDSGNYLFNILNSLADDIFENNKRLLYRKIYHPDTPKGKKNIALFGDDRLALNLKRKRKFEEKNFERPKYKRKY